ncbi:4Fe-4S binding protein [Pedosphaera parvula]|uniref:4Fe-4S ferredoxin iron-sulfur binding domain protein n=1 Tax=Pedosphaera parvula (strain Ellin514) TaxID=320771 RepID=B9XL68_PEDPL|nr:4Fe-4S binding protein [Pedosphaera parvula]EEF59419.1 4Fe-4S ferredoxin iron-sulfur binding domain protein [Pedosphaera parvula Ellin514]
MNASTASPSASSSRQILNADSLRQLCLELGADDVGFVELNRPALDPERADILTALPGTRTLISFTCRMNREPIRSPFRSLANKEFHQASDIISEVGHNISRELERKSIRALNISAGFPMEADRFPGRLWVISHKPLAEAAGLGRMGIHRNVIHPKFGSFILLGTILIDAEVTQYSHPIDYNPCVECKLCVAACPVGAIHADGHFNFSACYTHNYREFMGGFNDWVETIADSRNARDYRSRVTGAETTSMWQSLSFGANYKAAYCLAVCPAGEDVISRFLTNKKQFVTDILRPLQEKKETIYVIPGSDAEDHVKKRFPCKTVKQVHNGLYVSSIAQLLNRLHVAFQPNQSAGLDVTYHFTFTGAESVNATITIRDKRLTVQEGLIGTPNLHVTADATTWLGFLRKERNILWALLTRRIRLKGKIALLKQFARCFPS